MKDEHSGLPAYDVYEFTFRLRDDGAFALDLGIASDEDREAQGMRELTLRFSPSAIRVLQAQLNEAVGLVALGVSPSSRSQ